MPVTYDFECAACGQTHERKVKMGTPSDPCPRCGKPAARQFTPTDPARIRLWSERLHVMRSQVCAPVKRTQWRGIEGLK